MTSEMWWWGCSRVKLNHAWLSYTPKFKKKLCVIMSDNGVSVNVAQWTCDRCHFSYHANIEEKKEKGSEMRKMNQVTQES